MGTVSVREFSSYEPSAIFGRVEVGVTVEVDVGAGARVSRLSFGILP